MLGKWLAKNDRKTGQDTQASKEAAMKASDVMTRDVVTFAPDTPIQQIARTFRELGISGAPVVEDDKVIGVVTEVDIIARHARPRYPRYFPLLDAMIPIGGQREYQEIARHILGLTARDIMTTPVNTTDVDTDLEDVATLMVETRSNPVPVMDGEKLVGILSHTDLIRILEEAQPADDALAS
jgi:CBS domain-containing protein